MKPTNKGQKMRKKEQGTKDEKKGTRVNLRRYPKKILKKEKKRNSSPFIYVMYVCIRPLM
jgi:hypothetical protein